MNCHQHTETADFIGGLRPIRDRDKIKTELVQYLKTLLQNQVDDIDMTDASADDSDSVQKLYQKMIEKLSNSATNSLNPQQTVKYNKKF